MNGRTPGCLRIGLTGGIGSGKSTVASFLQGLGAFIIDADAISRAATASGGGAIEAIRANFGADFLTAQGSLDRDRMRSLVFEDPNAKRTLEGIVHPIVRGAMAEQSAKAIAEGAPCIIYDIPLLVESGRWREGVDRILVVDCSPETQIQRVHRRNGLDHGAVASILAAQAPRLFRLQVADAVLCNDGISFDELKSLTHQVWSRFGL